MNEFFEDHTYCIVPNILTNDRCNKMMNEVVNYNKKYYVEKPIVFDKLVQLNTKNLETQGPTRKYKAIYADEIKDMLPEVYSYYLDPDVISKLSQIVGVQLYSVPAYKTVDISVQIYEHEGDGANWHHDRSIYNGGRSFTFLSVIQNTSNQELTVWTEKYGIEKIKWSPCKTVLIEKFKTFHSVTPLTKGTRILLTFTYSEIPFKLSLMHPISYCLNKIKNFGYIGFDAFDFLDYTLVIITIIIIILIIYRKKINKKLKLIKTRK
jgi:hypothetical protein